MYFQATGVRSTAALAVWLVCCLGLHQVRGTTDWAGEDEVYYVTREGVVLQTESGISGFSFTAMVRRHFQSLTGGGKGLSELQAQRIPESVVQFAKEISSGNAIGKGLPKPAVTVLGAMKDAEDPSGVRPRPASGTTPSEEAKLSKSNRRDFAHSTALGRVSSVSLLSGGNIRDLTGNRLTTYFAGGPKVTGVPVPGASASPTVSASSPQNRISAIGSNSSKLRVTPKLLCEVAGVGVTSVFPLVSAVADVHNDLLEISLRKLPPTYRRSEFKKHMFIKPKSEYLPEAGQCLRTPDESIIAVQEAVVRMINDLEIIYPLSAGISDEMLTEIDNQWASDMGHANEFIQDSNWAYTSVGGPAKRLAEHVEISSPQRSGRLSPNGPSASSIQEDVVGSEKSHGTAFYRRDFDSSKSDGIVRTFLSPGKGASADDHWKTPTAKFWMGVEDPIPSIDDTFEEELKQVVFRNRRSVLPGLVTRSLLLGAKLSVRCAKFVASFPPLMPLFIPVVLCYLLWNGCLRRGQMIRVNPEGGSRALGYSPPSQHNLADEGTPAETSDQNSGNTRHRKHTGVHSAHHHTPKTKENHPNHSRRFEWKTVTPHSQATTSRVMKENSMSSEVHRTARSHLSDANSFLPLPVSQRSASSSEKQMKDSKPNHSRQNTSNDDSIVSNSMRRAPRKTPSKGSHASSTGWNQKSAESARSSVGSRSSLRRSKRISEATPSKVK